MYFFPRYKQLITGIYLGFFDLKLQFPNYLRAKSTEFVKGEVLPIVGDGGRS
jgi:hypothetical protein